MAPNFARSEKASAFPQARFSEIVGLPQSLLSSFELEKSNLSLEHLSKINNVLPNITSRKDIVRRKKRYRKHTYSGRKIDNTRHVRCQTTAENAKFLEALRDLQVIPSSSFSGLSLFAGIGGFSLGFRRAGCSIKGFVEIDNNISKMYEANFNAARIGADVKQLSSNYLEDLLACTGPIDVVIGGPPCQGFSLSGKTKGGRSKKLLVRRISSRHRYYISSYSHHGKCPTTHFDASTERKSGQRCSN